jgi:hypothetical protein
MPSEATPASCTTAHVHPAQLDRKVAVLFTTTTFMRAHSIILPSRPYILRNALLTNLICVVKVRTFAVPPNSPAAHWGAPEYNPRIFLPSLIPTSEGRRVPCDTVFHEEGCRGLYRRTSLALFGVSNGSKDTRR